MQLPGIITIGPDQPEQIEKAAVILGESFMEEPWFKTWLSALDKLGTSYERKRDILVAATLGEFEAHAPYRAIFATEDFAGVAGAYLASEFKGVSHVRLEDEGINCALADVLTPEERELLDARSKAMEPISNFSWAADHAAGADHIYFFAWAIDSSKRGSGAFRRLITPFFDFADERGINCYLDCFNDNLQSLYEHVGFEVIDILRAEGFEIAERRMVRRPRRKG